MFNMILKDFRISPLRTFLTGFSMFIGIISMIAAVLVGTLGKESLLSVNAQIFGYSPTYSISIVDSNLLDVESMEKFIEKLQVLRGRAVVVDMNKEYNFAPMHSINQLNESNQLYKKLRYVETVYTSSGYNEVYNIPIYKGRWFDKTKKSTSLEVVVNKKAYEIYNTKYIVASKKDSLNLIPFNVVGVANDGKDYPLIYVNVKPILAYMYSNFTVGMLKIYWHHDNDLSIAEMRSHVNDLLYDTIGGKVDNISRTDGGDNYVEVIDMLQIGLIISSGLLLLVAILGQINIGLSSLEQRTHELLIRRALGASKYNISILVLSSIVFLSIVVCIISVLISLLVVYSIGLILPNDSPITAPKYPIIVAFIAIIASVGTAILGGLIPAIKASKIEPALALR